MEAVHAPAQEAKGGWTTIPKYELYKELRCEELNLYRSAVTVFSMHNNPMTKPQAADTGGSA